MTVNTKFSFIWHDDDLWQSLYLASGFIEELDLIYKSFNSEPKPTGVLGKLNNNQTEIKNAWHTPLTRWEQVSVVLKYFSLVA